MSLGTNFTLISAQTTGSGDPHDVVAVSREIKFYVIGNGAVTAGEVTLEEAHDQTYAGTWSALPDGVLDVTGGAVLARPYSGCFRAVRARITVNIVGGTVTVVLMGNKEP